MVFRNMPSRVNVPPLDAGAKAEETPIMDARIASFIFIQSMFYVGNEEVLQQSRSK